MEDPFKASYYKYSFEDRCEENTDIRLNDGTKKVFINANGTDGNVSKDLKQFIDYIAGKSAESDFTKKLDEVVNMVKQDAQSRREYLLAHDRDRQIKEQGIDVGIDIGINGTVTILRSLNLSDDEIVEKLMSTYNIDRATAKTYL